MCRLLVFILGTSHKSDLTGSRRDWRKKLVAQLPLDTCLLLRCRKLSYDVMRIAGCWYEFASTRIHHGGCRRLDHSHTVGHRLLYFLKFKMFLARRLSELTMVYWSWTFGLRPCLEQGAASWWIRLRIFLKIASFRAEKAFRSKVLLRQQGSVEILPLYDLVHSGVTWRANDIPRWLDSSLQGRGLVQPLRALILRHVIKQLLRQVGFPVHRGDRSYRWLRIANFLL